MRMTMTDRIAPSGTGERLSKIWIEDFRTVLQLTKKDTFGTAAFSADAFCELLLTE
jgi:hypothetical protein